MILKIIPILIVLVLICGCISGGGGDTTTPAPTTAPTTAAPTTTAALTTAAPTTTVAPTLPPTTEPPKPSEMDDAWTMIYKDEYGTNYSPDSLPQTPEVLWYRDGVFLGPSVIEYGHVYVPVQKLDDVQGDRLVCLDLEDGSTVWESALQYNRNMDCTDLVYYRSPAISEEKIVFLSCGNSCILQCFDAFDGTKAWEKTVDTNYRIYLSPTIADGKVYVMYTNSICYGDFINEYNDFADLNNGRIACYDLETGNMLWEERMNLAFYGNPIIYDDKVYFGAVDGATAIGYLVCLDAEDGELLWTNELLSADRALYNLDEPVWRIAYGHDNIYVTLFDYDIDWAFFGYSSIACYDPDNGDRKWEFMTDTGFFFGDHLSISEDYVYFGVRWNTIDEPSGIRIYKLDPSNGNILWSSYLPDFMDFMVMGGDTLYVGFRYGAYNADVNKWEYDNNFYGISGNSGVQNWFYTESPDYSSMVIYGGIYPSVASGYYVASVGFRLYCFT
ncbi:MAG TPA: PQQ-like beta-propeller repeat protein [Candidatus Methanofastidiosa archaeon]|nr:PQQ-like beta-propeller repeat protein [Candidatus Methanofastidiosa archaeon]